MAVSDLYFSFQGRISRKAFWLYWVLPTLVSVLVLYALNAGRTVLSLFYILLLWPFLAVYAKRLHDLNKSGWLQLAFLIPIVGGITIFVICGFIKGTPGPNAYGEDPLEDDYPGADVLKPAEDNPSGPEKELDIGGLFGRVILLTFSFILFLAIFSGSGLEAHNKNDQNFLYVLIFLGVIVGSVGVRLLLGALTSQSALGSVVKLFLGVVLCIIVLGLTFCTAIVSTGWKGG